MTTVGIVGAEGAKFTAHGEQAARGLIRLLLAERPTLVVSGACHLGGIDVWAEEIAKELDIPFQAFPPKALNWSSGYKPRNIQIARASDVVHNITVQKVPVGFKGMQFLYCYHCKKAARPTDHVKSGGCWTALYAENLGKQAHWHVIEADWKP